MKIAFLFHTSQWTRGLEQIIQAFTKEGHYVYLMINDAKQRKQIARDYKNNSHIHIELEYEYANSGDLSLPKFYLLMMRKGLLNPEIKYFIALQEHMAPLKTNAYIEDFLQEQYPANFYKIFEQSIDRKYLERYFPYTNLKSFSTSKLLQNWSKTTAALLSVLRIKRKPSQNIVVGSPYFMISDQGAHELVNQVEYLLDNFKLSWFPEQIALPTMLHKFTTQKHINNHYILNNQTKPFSLATPIDFSENDLTAQQLFGGPYDLAILQQLIQYYHSISS